MAKPITRFARQLANKLGYDLLRLQKIHIYDEALSGLGRGGGFDAFEATVPRDIKSVDIFLRSCAGIEVHGQERGRFNGAPKSEVLFRCLRSLVSSINHAIMQGGEVPISLVVIDDHSSHTVVERIERILETGNFPARLHPLKVKGMSSSLTETFELARRDAEDVIYLLEDDYLHDLRSIYETVESYAQLSACVGEDVILFPSDYPETYKHVRPSHVLLGSHRHWRRIYHTTGTQVLSRSILEAHWENYKALTAYGSDPEITEENTINRVLKTVSCYAPLPALAVHFQHFDTISPYVDWQAWWDQAGSK